MNKVIILGGDHHNALGLARVFGINGIKPYGVITTFSKREKDNFCHLSKYWEKTWFALSEDEALEILKFEFCHEKEKPVLVPSSDGMAYVIDTRLDELSEWFIVPGINQTQGEIARLMDKKNQSEWAQQIGIRTAKTWCLDLTEDFTSLCLDIVYPCVLKPVVSAEGHKTDIRKCDNINDFKEQIALLKDKGYHRILVQEFLKKDYETELFGCIGEHTNRIPYLFSKHVREWPTVGGTVSFHQFIDDKRLINQAEYFLNQIRNYGYRGNIDIELFVINGELILNEVNFRNSGDVYACINHNVHYPVFSYYDMIGKDTSHLNINYSSDYYAMDEATDLRHVVYGSLSLKKWLKCLSKSSDFAFWFKGDMKPVWRKYGYFLKKMISKKNES